MVTYLSQLNQMGVFKKVNGILLGTFTKMEEDNCQPDMAQLILDSQKKDTRCEITFDRAWNGFKGDSHRASFKVILRRRKQTDI